MRSTFKILFYLKKNAPKPDGTVPIMCRITVDGAIAQFSCKTSVSIDLWDIKANRAIGKSKDALKINAKIDNIRTSINNNYQILMQKDGFATAEKIKNTYLGLDIKQHTLMALFSKHNEELSTKVGITRAKSTYLIYLVIYKHLTKFLAEKYNRNDIALREIDISFINEFDNYLRTKRSCSTNSINNYIKSLKHIVAEACQSGILLSNPFNQYKIENEQHDRGFLTSEELQKIMDVKFTKAMPELIRDIFVFCSFCGLAYVDVKNLTADNVVKSFDGHLWIDTRRQKTHISSVVRLLEVPKRILEKYNGLSKNGKLFPIPSNKYCNIILKKIGLDCKIKTKLTFHTARHNKYSSPLITSNLQNNFHQRVTIWKRATCVDSRNYYAILKERLIIRKDIN